MHRAPSRDDGLARAEDRVDDAERETDLKGWRALRRRRCVELAIDYARMNATATTSTASAIR